MEWVETTGRTLEEAKEAALDQLGVDERDAEFEVLAEPRRGLFGIGGTDARVRARVRPARPRAKDDRRRRRERGRGGRDGGRDRERETRAAATADVPARATAQPTTAAAVETIEHDDDDGGDDVEADLSVPEQAEVARTFVAGLVEAFGLRASVAVTDDGDDTIDVAVTGDDLGVLIGPKGATLQAIQELAKTAVQRRTPGRTARLHVDVAGYRAKRKDALERFTHQVAEQVKSSGTRRALEPMNAADRKIVHDTANEIEGVTTTSEGEEPRRRVVILPAGDD
ncbi:MAG TPA: RNA-binding cell elongation regulator Jag/EloR [Acidimicrobiales bacterium]|nr:RNA-binding cell elongation regulator Jag/EloR [Acidimicrobiales bacterium]